MTENITVFTQSSIRIRSGMGTIYLDPIGIPEEFHDADYVLITHNHSDHFTPSEIEKVSKPEIAIPTHYGSIVGKATDAELFASRVQESVKVELKINV